MAVNKKIICLFIIIAVVIMTSAVSARIRNIPGEYPTIQAGINDCSGGDTLLVQPGIYIENLNFNGQNFILASLFIISGDESYISSTIIDGDSIDPVITVENGEDSTSTVIGFTIQNGSSDYGAGIYIENSSPTFKYNIICANNAYLHFGGGGGGGIYCRNSNARIWNNLIYGNTTSGSYGGFGGGVYFYNSAASIINNTITQNFANHSGGGMFFFNSPSTAINTIVWGNIALETGSQVHVEHASPSITYCDIYAGWPGEGNINANPEFRSIVNEDFHLMALEYGFPWESPCIDAGQPDILDAELDSLWGLGTVIGDMGAYGGGYMPQVGIQDNEIANPEIFTLLQNYPNPFNSSTTISFNLTEPQFVSLIAFDLLGREIATLLNDYMIAGNHSVNFDAGDLSSGIYFYRLEAGDEVKSKRMLYLK